jgi:hypothetical protein
VKSILSDGIPQTCLPFGFVDIIVITVHDRFWNVDQGHCILKYFENMMTDLQVEGEPVIRPLTKSINKTLYNTNTKGFIFVWPSRMYMDVDESDMDVG